MNCKYKSFMTKKKAFTLIELLIVIAIIGILFVVLVSKVDFATDKAKATGVQTDFRSFQMALETVSKEKAGFNSFGWNTGDANANGVRDSVDEGDTNKDGIYQEGETWTGRKKYLETWTDKYSLIRPGTTFETDGYDKDAIFALETAINKNLDPKLHITIDAKTGLITMANGAQDPWNTQYHGAYISAEDGMDRGAIVMYSNGANQKFGSEHDIANGVPTVIVPGNNKNGADDYSMVVCYTYKNGIGEVGNLTTGFNNNQTFLSGKIDVEIPDNIEEALELPDKNPMATLNDYSWTEIKALAQAKLSASEYKSDYGIELGQKKNDQYILVDFDNYNGFVFMYDTNKEVKLTDGNGSFNDSNLGGYQATHAPAALQNIYDNLTDENLKDAIKPVTIYHNDGELAPTEIHQINNVYMFLPSAVELGFDMSTYTWANSYAQEGTKFDYFVLGPTSLDVNDPGCILRRTLFDNINMTYWLRTAYTEYENPFFFLTGGWGYLSSNGGGRNRGIIACFVIG